MTSKQRVQSALAHRMPDCVPVDFGATSVTGIHCKVVEALRQHYGWTRILSESSTFSDAGRDRE